MRITERGEREFRADFMPLIIELRCGDNFDSNNGRHAEWLDRKIRAGFFDFGTAVCAYTDEDEPIGYIRYKHDTGMENADWSGAKAGVIQMGLFERFRRRGIGTAPLDDVCLRIKEAGGKCLYTDTYAENRDAMCFYIKRKFTPVSLHPGEGQVYLYRAS